MVRKEVLANLIDSKKAAILKTLLNAKDEMYLKEISEKSNVSITSTFRIVNDLVNLEILQKREWKTSKVYSAAGNEKTEFLKELFYEEYDGINDFVGMIKDLSGVQNIFLHGTRKSGEAKIILIGEHINASRVEEALQEVQKKGFELNYLSLAKGQYEHMVKMGLYSGGKKVLK